MAMVNTPIHFDGAFPWGKHKSKPVAWVIEHDTEYLLWLRHERYKGGLDGPMDDLGFDGKIHDCLDVYLDANPKLSSTRGYRKFSSYSNKFVPIATNVAEVIPEPVKAREMAEWAQW